jgi:hypothetical protein
VDVANLAGEMIGLGVVMIAGVRFAGAVIPRRSS